MADGRDSAELRSAWGLVSPGHLLALSRNAASCGGAPFLILAIGRDAHSWGLSIVGAEQSPAKAPQRIVTLREARWRQDLPTLQDVALTASGALRETILGRGWNSL